MVKQFDSEKEMLQYEENREKFYLNEIDEINRHWWNCYVQMLKYAFNSKYRALKKEYDSYAGGYWLDASKHICSYHLSSFYSKDYPEGSIGIHCHDTGFYDAYIMYQGAWQKIKLMSIEELMEETLSNDETT